jgi:hypothetical protein
LSNYAKNIFITLFTARCEKKKKKGIEFYFIHQPLNLFIKTKIKFDLVVYILFFTVTAGASKNNNIISSENFT